MDARLMMDTFETGLPRNLVRLPIADEREERLPFTVRTVTTAEQLGKAVAIRHSAYGRHVPALAERLRLAEALDHASGSTVLLAESKLDGEPLGSMRIQTNRYAPLAVEGSVTLPRALAGRSLAEATRLGVSGGRIGHLVKATLFKAFYLYCTKEQIDWMVITARAPLDRMYQALLFSDVFPDRAPIAMKHVADIPHRVLRFEVDTAEERWRAGRHPLYDFVFSTRHPDIDLDATEESPVIERPQEARTALAA